MEVVFILTSFEFSNKMLDQSTYKWVFIIIIVTKFYSNKSCRYSWNVLEVLTFRTRFSYENSYDKVSEVKLALLVGGGALLGRQAPVLNFPQN